MLKLFVIPLILSTLILFILTRWIYVNIRRDESLTIELHFPILALYLRENKAKRKKAKNKRTNKFSSYLNIIKAISVIIKGCELTLRRISFPSKADRLDNTITRTYSYYSLTAAALAYLDERAIKLTVLDDAFLPCSASNSFRLDLSIKTRLFTLLLGLFRIRKKMNR